MDAFLAGLNSAQRAAVTSPANVVQVLAPPGSGKTKTLTARVAYLISQCGYKPWNIIVCTFTVKAAKEMQHRLIGQIGEEAAKKLVLGTFHSVARRYLMRYGEEIGLKKGWGIADAGDQKAIVKRIIKETGLGIEAGKALGRISACKSRSKTADMVRMEMKKKDEEGVEFVAVYDGYESALELSNLLDYDDLLLRCKDLLRKSPSVVGNVQAVLIDEFQDTNEVQFELMSYFAQRHKTITIVGDPDQSIYGWRNAEMGNLNKMKALYPDTVVIFLEENYRSSGGILSAAQTVIEQDKARPDKKLQATHSHGETPVLRRLPTAEVEARWLVAEIKRSLAMSGGMLEHNDYAILLRSAQLSRHIEQALGNAGLPYRMVGGTKFYDRVEIKILLDYLRVVEHPEHNDALLRIINIPSRNVGEVTVKKLLDEATSKGLPVWKLLLDSIQGNTKTSTKISSQAERGLSEFINIILIARKKKDTTSPFDLLDLLLKRLDYKTFLSRKYPEDADERLTNVSELQTQTKDLTAAMEAGTFGDEPLPSLSSSPANPGAEEGAESPLSLFLANIALSSAADASSAPTSTITISTIHAAKGLEWPVVFLPACYDGSIPHSRAENHDEERRLLYVGMTRAQGLLYLSCPMKSSQGGETVLSPFLTQEGVEKLFAPRAPELDSYVRIGKLAGTLGRVCPSFAQIEEKRKEVEDWDDVRWPVDGSWPIEEQGRWDRGKPGFGREGSGLGGKQGFVAAARVTMEKVEGFGMQTTVQSLHGTFASARSRMQELDAVEEESRMKAMEKKMKEEGKGRSKMEVAQAKHGGDIKTFFGGGGLVRQSSSGSTKSEKVEVKQVVSVRRPLVEVMPIPQGLGHRVATQPLLKRPRLEETRPNVPTGMAGNGPVTTTKAQSQARSTTWTESRDPASTGTSTVRPATTMHTTSMAALSTNNVPKRTLGMGRTFKPWSARTNK
ncbi:UvrD/REP helicase N-terminal domain-containing protein [Elsinoe fawcettii]|nr:UvrD/REP helicase N-terminal domain-containing protein [Elsinoe fawcettii]